MFLTYRCLPRCAVQLSLLAVGILSCGDDDPSGPSETAVRVTVGTTGSPADPDGYAVSIDAGTPETVDINGSVTFEDLASGGHTLLLTGVAANCTVEGDNPRTVSVDAGEIAETTFSVACAPGTGTIAVTTTTTGESVDADGYTISVDGGSGQAIGANSTVTITGLSVGEHSVELGDIASHCSLGGSANPMILTVVAGEPSDVIFAVTCTALPGPTGRIFFSANITGVEPYDVYVMNADGSDPVQLSDTPDVLELGAELSPDGTRVAVSRLEQSGEQIYVMNADGSNPVQLTDNDDGGFDPTWSPDGSRIAFVSGRDGDLEIYVMDADGSNVDRLTTSPGIELSPDWSPDGSTIAFNSQRTGEDEIFLMDADGSNQRNLTDLQADGTGPAWSPDGTKLAFRSTRDVVDGELYVINADATGLQRLTFRPGEEHDPDWSPDGSMIAFTINGSDIARMNLDGSGLVQLTSSPALEVRPDWTE
jgi:WD40 repeat protein